jgi:transcriptional regulator with PAS, ATPase and Fis domain
MKMVKNIECQDIPENAVIGGNAIGGHAFKLKAFALKPGEVFHFGGNPNTDKILEYAQIASETLNVILLLGETGTGKGLLARWIHDHSRRATRPFVEVNCSSLKGDLLRSELFGHVRGAFTSAIRDKMGLLDVANGGTLFLDEIGDMDIEVQAQLLKTIEERTFRRVGDAAIRKSHFRLICATNKNLLEVDGTQFRRDLYYRISVFPITLTPLRAKVDEIPGLCQHLLSVLGYEHPLSEEITNMLSIYSWPGNARELRNVLERAIMLARGKELTLNHFNIFASPEAGYHKSQKLADVEQEHMLSVLREHNNDMEKTRMVLGVSLSSLYRMIRKAKGKSYKKRSYTRKKVEVCCGA